MIKKKVNKNGFTYSPRCTKGEASIRKKIISRWIRDGHSRAELIEMCHDKWGLKEYSANDYIYSIYNDWEKLYDKNKQHYALSAIEKRHDLYIKAVKRKDFSTARNILIDIDKTTGNWEENLKIKADISFSDWVKGQKEKKDVNT